MGLLPIPRDQEMSELIKRKVRAAIVQDPVVSQLGKRNIVVNVMINGSDAIDKACADDGDVLAAMKYIISVLPEPRKIWLMALAMAAAEEVAGTKTGAARLLGMTRPMFGEFKFEYAEKIKAIRCGEVTFERQD